ncbi:helix-turn-helix domain-containing protein [Burkholderia multivorans]|uniref:helix-turn-helix domain-containing protein n=1 Tax=Burkholderia multivorans TaxID=87883 RepID=UPI0021BE0AF0|nr:helix-turn-helix transcriptional regulator [Burkholderia multivorans]
MNDQQHSSADALTEAQRKALETAVNVLNINWEHETANELWEAFTAPVSQPAAAPINPIALAEQARLQDYAEQNMLTLEEAADELRASEHSGRVLPIDTTAPAPSPADERAALAKLRAEMFDWLASCTKEHIDGKIEFINRVTEGFAAIYARSAASPAAEVAQWQSRLKDRSSPVVDHWVNISPDGAKTLMEKYSDVYEVRALYTAPRSPAVAAEAVADERAAFEKVFPMPADCQRIGSGPTAGYAPTEYGAWEAHDFIRRWEGWKARAAASPAAEAVPAGWKLVPIEPTEEMSAAGGRFLSIMSLPEREAGSVYRAMLAAAPQPAQADAPAEAREPAKVDTKARMDWAAGILRKLPPLDPTYSIISILDDHDPEDRDEVLHSIRVFADMRATQALFTLYRAPADSGEARLTDEPSLTNPLTPYGMLVRALRIVSGTTLMDMAKALLTTPAKLSAMEFGRAPVTPEFAFDVAAYFEALGVPCTEYALRAAARAQGGDHDQ